MEKKTLLDNLDIVMLAFDEICDGGWVECQVLFFQFNFLNIFNIICNNNLAIQHELLNGWNFFFIYIYSDVEISFVKFTIKKKY